MIAAMKVAYFKDEVDFHVFGGFATDIRYCHIKAHDPQVSCGHHKPRTAIIWVPGGPISVF